jgi:hypothetical protein
MKAGIQTLFEFFCTAIGDLFNSASWFADLLRKYKKANGFLLVDLARKLGADEATIHNWGTEKNKPTPKSIFLSSRGSKFSFQLMLGIVTDLNTFGLFDQTKVHGNVLISLKSSIILQG